MNTVQSFISKIQHAATQHPYRWSVRKQIIIVLLGIGLAAVIGLIKVSLRYDSNESERWWWYYFTDQLIGWGHWMIWLPLLINLFHTTFSKIKGELKSLLLMFAVLILVGVIAATTEGLLWHSFFNKRPDWPWPRVWKASISNRFGFHFLVGTTTSLLLLARQLWYLARDKRENKNLLVRYESEVQPGSLIIRHKGKTEFIPLSEISHLSASGSYVEIFTPAGKTVVTGTLKNFEKQLPDSFVRIHRSYIVRIDAIRTMNPLTNEDYKIITASGHELRLSRNYKDSLSRLKGTTLP